MVLLLEESEKVYKVERDEICIGVSGHVLYH